MYLIRLDDACEYMDLSRWERVLSILRVYNVCPLIGIIPQCKDENFVAKYPHNPGFWEMARSWEKEGFIIAMHGLHHVYHKSKGGLNPLYDRSEFVGLLYEEQAKKIRLASSIFAEQNLHPKVFFCTFPYFRFLYLRSTKT